MSNDEVIRLNVVTGREVLKLEPTKQLVYLEQVVEKLPIVIGGTFSGDERIAQVVGTEGGFYSQVRDFSNVKGYIPGFYPMCVMASILNYWKFKGMDNYIPEKSMSSDKVGLGSHMAYRAGALWGDFSARNERGIHRMTSTVAVFKWLDKNNILGLRHTTEDISPLRLAYTLLNGGGAVIYGRAPFARVALSMERKPPYNVTFVDSHLNPAGVTKMPFIEIFNPNEGRGNVIYERGLLEERSVFHEVELMYPEKGRSGASETTPWDRFIEQMRVQVFVSEKRKIAFEETRPIVVIKKV